MLFQGPNRAFDVEMDNLGGSSVVPVYGADSGFYHELQGVRIAHVAERVPRDALGRGLELGVELAQGLPLDAQHHPPRYGTSLGGTKNS